MAIGWSYTLGIGSSEGFYFAHEAEFGTKDWKETDEFIVVSHPEFNSCNVFFKNAYYNAYFKGFSSISNEDLEAYEKSIPGREYIRLLEASHGSIKDEEINDIVLKLNEKLFSKWGEDAIREASREIKDEACALYGTSDLREYFKNV